MRVLLVELLQFGSQEFLVRQLRLVLGDERRRQAAAEGILHDFIILAGAEKYPERRTLVTLLYRPVERFQVELQLPQVLRAERVDLEFNRHQAVQTAVEKQQIERKILSADLQRVFRTHKAETRPSSMRKSRNLSSSARCRSASA